MSGLNQQVQVICDVRANQNRILAYQKLDGLFSFSKHELLRSRNKYEDHEQPKGIGNALNTKGDQKIFSLFNISYFVYLNVR